VFLVSVKVFRFLC